MPDSSLYLHEYLIKTKWSRGTELRFYMQRPPPSALPLWQVGPEKGVLHLAVAGIVNALWDLWARLQNKPLWKLLVDMEPEKLVSTIDFRYMYVSPARRVLCGEGFPRWSSKSALKEQLFFQS